MSETVNQGNNSTAENTAGTERTFTQAELDQIVKDRLERANAKYADYEALKDKAAKYDEQVEAEKTELQKATDKANALQEKLDALNKANEVKAVREKVATEMKIPANLLTADTEKDCKAQAQALLEWAKPSGYPKVKDGGEVNNTSGGTNGDKFAEWFEANGF